MNEARAVNAIRHPNIIDIIDVGTVPGGARPYLMMEYLEGESLGQRLKREPALPIADAVEIACQTASALAAAHDQGIIHRDLKPDNLFLVGGGPLRVKVLDFGVAKLRRELSGASLNTSTGTLLGTPRYMSPEQCLGGSAVVDQRSDVYSLGVIVYQMLCGSAPFMNEGFGEVLMKHMTAPPPPLRDRRPGIPPFLEAAVLRALAKPPRDRFATMAELEAALRGEELHESPAPATPAAFAAAVDTANATLSALARPDETVEVTTLSSTTGAALTPVNARGRVRGWWAVTAVAVGAALAFGTSRLRAPTRPSPAALAAPAELAPALAPVQPPVASPPPAASPGPERPSKRRHRRHPIADPIPPDPPTTDELPAPVPTLAPERTEAVRPAPEPAPVKRRAPKW